jgi:hypothetical protein
MTRTTVQSKAPTKARMMIAAAALLALAAGSPAAAAPATTDTAVFALIVTNNRSTRLERPDLQYADDDGARYYQLFRGVAAADRLWLLTRFDRATAAIHPELVPVARPPRLAELRGALGSLRAAIAAARRAGQRTELYFVFAGHGDVEGGVGYLDLEDGRIDSAFLEREVVDDVAADVEHIVLDSCNSFFVVNPRKPGGRRWATPSDLALGFAKHHPNVGLFLSTNSEAEVYEWSELESGIFSHEVRSGLSGAADANGDGQVSYAELAGFVERANARLPRANLRPQVFHRGPGGEADAPLFSPALARGRRIDLGAGERRVWIRGAAAERLIDLHKEEGAMTVVVPGQPEQPLSIVEWRAARAPGLRPSVLEYDVPAGDAPVSLAALAEHPADAGPRGGAAMFANLFEAPYGPHAFAVFRDGEARAPEPVFGISASDEARMRHYLTFIAESDRVTSRSQAYALGGLGALFVATGAGLYVSQPRWNDTRGLGVAVGGLGALLLGAGIRIGVMKLDGEAALQNFELQLRASPDNRALAVARTEESLDQLARGERRTRRVAQGFIGGTALLVAGITTTELVTGDLHPRRNLGGLTYGYGFAAVMGLLLWESRDIETPTERLLRLYRSDPELKIDVGIAPTPGGGGVSLSGRF